MPGLSCAAKAALSRMFAVPTHVCRRHICKHTNMSQQPFKRYFKKYKHKNQWTYFRIICLVLFPIKSILTLIHLEKLACNPIGQSATWLIGFHHDCCSGLFITDGSHVSRGVTKTFNYECYLHIWMLFVYTNLNVVYTHPRLIGQGPPHCIGMYWWHEWATSPVHKTVEHTYITYTYIHAEYIYSAKDIV